MGFFAGINSCGKTVIFALAVLKSATKSNFEVLISSFCDLMGKDPQTIITDQDKAFISCLKEMKEHNKIETSHVYDSWHFLRTLTSKVLVGQKGYESVNNV